MKQQWRMGIMIVLLLVAVTLAILTYNMQSITNPFMRFLAHQHVTLMLVLVIISMGFGYVWANVLQTQLRKEQIQTQELLAVLKDLLNKEEQLVISMLVDHDGKIGQSDIAKREIMTRVKAHRTVKALEERGVVHTEKIGKRVYVYLDTPILEKLR